MRGALIHGVLLAVMLVYGYRTWTRDQTVQPDLGSVVLWDKTDAELASIELKTEKKQRWNLAVAVEGAKDGSKDGYRAAVFADVDLFADLLVRDQIGRPVMLMLADAAGGGVVEDAIRWLGGEEVFSGEIVSEDDKPIQHTKNQDVVWFMLTIVGFPLLVLTLGLLGTTRRRRSSKKAEVSL